MTKKCQNCGHGIMDHYVTQNRLGSCSRKTVVCEHCNNTGIVRRLEHFNRGLTSLTATVRRVCEHCKTYHHRLTGGNWLDYWAEGEELVNLADGTEAGSRPIWTVRNILTVEQMKMVKKCKCKKFVPFDTLTELKRRVKVLS